MEEFIGNTDLLIPAKPTNITRVEDEVIYKMLLSTNGLALRFINNPTYEEMLIAVSQNGRAITYIPTEKRDDRLRETAIENDPLSIWSMKDEELPTKLWVAAVRTPYCDHHPIHLLTHIKYDNISPYLAFISNNKMHFHKIVDEIHGLRFEHLIWKYVYLCCPEIPDKDQLCPFDIQVKIFDSVVNTKPYLLEEFSPSLWTFDYVKNYIKKMPWHVGLIYEKYSHITRAVLYRLALDNCKDVHDVRSVLALYPTIRDADKSFTEFQYILESPNWVYVLESYISIFSIFADSIENCCKYVMQHFTMEQLYNNLSENCLNRIIERLPFLERIKYKLILNKFKRRNVK